MDKEINENQKIIWAIVKQLTEDGMLVYKKVNQDKTGEEACKVISKFLKEVCNIIMPAKDIWDMSPTGELWPIHVLYHFASAYFDNKDEIMKEKRNND